MRKMCVFLKNSIKSALNMPYIDQDALDSKDRPISPDHRNNASVFGTFGTLRYLLAFMVIITHTGPSNWAFTGQYAVFSFFILSGYVVSYILTHTYLPLPNGLWHYARNRALRILPLYWFAALAAIPITLWYPNQGHSIDISFGLPPSALSWAHNIFIMTTNYYLNSPGTERPALLLPVAWSLSNEIIYWGVIPLVLVFPQLQKILLIYAVLYTAYAYETHAGASGIVFWLMVKDRYFSVQAAALPFTLGLYLFLGKQYPKKHVTPVTGYAAMAGFVFLLYMSHAIFTDMIAGGFYASIALSTLVIGHLSQVDPRTLPLWFQHLDRFLGNLSYPIYLIHMSIGTGLLIIVPELTPHSTELAFATLALSTPLAWLLNLMVEKPINRWRRAKS